MYRSALERLRCVFILGGGRTGRSAARWLKARGIAVMGWDDQESARTLWSHDDVEMMDPNTSSSWDWGAVDGLLVAPGIPHLWPAMHPIVYRACQSGVPLLSDLDLWTQDLPHGGRIISVTGTNGKSTTTALIHHMLRAQAYHAVMGGNMGTPVFDLPSQDFYVIEASSYQLERTQSFVCDVGVLLNITPDHLDRHGGMAGYSAAKQKMFRLRPAPQTFVVGVDTAPTQQITAWLQDTIPSTHTLVPISITQPLKGLTQRPSSLNGAHNMQNLLCAYAVGQSLGLSSEAMVTSFQNFPGLEHRQEYVAQQSHTTWVNDSKATNISSVCTALACLERVYLIAGGRPKKEPLNPLLNFRDRIQKIFLIGEATVLWSAFFAQHHIPFESVSTLDRAVEAAGYAAQQDTSPHTILLSPGCASFDQFAHFEARGQMFKKLVLARFSGHG